MNRKTTFLRWLGSFMVGVFLLSGIGLNAYAQQASRRAPVDPSTLVGMPAERQNAGTFTPSNREAQNIDITVDVDNWFDEAEWNIWSYDQGAYYYPSWQLFSSSFEVVNVIVGLEPGDYSIDVWDDFGDGGIGGIVKQGLVTLVSWDNYDYTDFAWFDFTVFEPAPRVDVTPLVLDLGDRPINSWTEPAYFTVQNTGVGPVTINNAEIAADAFFGVAAPSFPITLEEGETVEIGITATGNAAPGLLEGDFVVQWGAGREVTVTEFMANAYEPIVADVVETAIELPVNTMAPASLPIADSREFGGIYKNYILPNDVGSGPNDNDYVYLLLPATDMLFDVYVTSGSANFAIYAADFSGEDGPMATNALVQAVDAIDDFELFAGTYYLVGSSLDVWGGSFNVDAMPDPEAAINIAPADGAVDIINGTDLEWAFGANTLEYQVILGTTYPPATVVVDWTDELATSYTLSNLEPNLQYFWQVNVRNNGATTTGEVWGFTTTLTPPSDLTGNAEVYEGEDVVLTWESPVDRAFLGYNVFKDGIQQNVSMLTEATYTDVAPAYNMTPGYEYTVTAIYDEGESDHSAPFTAQVTGEGTLNGNVSDLNTGDDIAGATVSMIGVDEFGEDQSYSTTTDANGNYTADVFAGTYDIRVTADGYLPAEVTGVALAYGATETTDFVLNETPYPVAVVTASEFGENILIEWSFDLVNFVPQVYPFDSESMNEAQIQKMWKGFLAENNFDATAQGSDRALVEFQVWREKAYLPGTIELVGTTSQFQFVDFDWDVQDWGVYKWYVVAVYDLNESDPVGSNTVDKDMNTVVDVTVALNSADSPAGTLVEFTNVDESPELIYSALLPASGEYEWSEFRKGTYDILVSLPGYGVVNETGVDIFDETSFEWLLEELLATPADLYVTPTGFATWTGGSGEVPFVPVVVDFNDGIPADWTVEDGELANASGGSWQVVPSTSGRYMMGDDYVIADSDAAGSGSITHTILTSAVYPAEGESALYVEFDQYYYYSSYYPTFSKVSVFDGTSWVVVLDQTATSGTWSTPAHIVIDVSAYANADFQVRFEYYGDWSFYWGVDNIGITNATPPTRSFETYKVFLDGTLLGEVTETEYQHGGFGEILVDGETYTTGVAAVFSTGQSATAEFTWLYVACDNYDAPTAFTAEQVIGTLDVALNWTNVDAAALDTISALRIYRNGEEYVELDFTAGAVDTYLDEELEFGTYNYCLTYIYDSGAETCVDAVCSEDVVITGGGYVNGTVTAFDGGAPIGGATVTIFNDNFSFEFTTNASGYYEGEVVDGTYDYLVGAENFESQLLEDVTITFGETVTQNFQLLEFPFPVNSVVAEYQGENAVKVYWNSPGTSGGGGTVFEDFDDGMPSMLVVDEPVANWTVANSFLNLSSSGTSAWRSAYYNAEYSDVLFEVETQRTTGATTGAMGIYVRGTGVVDPTVGNGESANVFTITQSGSWWYATLLNGDLMGDWTGWMTSSAINTSGPNVITAVAQGTTVQFFVNNTLVYTVNNTTLTEGKVGMFIAEGTAAATTVWDYMMIEPGGVVTRDYETNHIAIESKGSLSESYIAYENTVEPKGVSYHKNTASSRELEGYNVYRMPCYDDEDFTFLGYTLDTVFVDNQFGGLDAGVYKWAVEAVYTNNEAEPQFSNCLDKDMITTVSVTVTTNSGDSPEETDVMFTNISEPDLELVYEVELDETGFYAWEEFRKGVYDIYVEKNGFAPIELMGYVIDGPEAFEWLLEELLLPVADLYVTPTGFATWRSGGEIPFEPFMEGFNDGLPETWTIIDGGSTSDTWYNVTPAGNPQSPGSSLDGTPFMFADSDGAGSGSTMDEQMISPVINAENADELYLMFDYLYINLSTSEYFSVDVFDGDDWVEVFFSQTDSGSWPWDDATTAEIDVTEYANDMFQVRFNYFSPGWNWYVAVDNVVVTDNMDRYADRELQYYKVWLDNNFIVDTENTFWQYDVTNLVPGQDYLAEVAAVYSNGISERMQYVWTYVPCEDYAGPQVYNGEVINDNDVLLTWSDVEPLELIQITQNPGAPSNGYFQQFGYGYGVAYDLSAYPDAMVNSLDFHHASWGTTGTWEYNIHIFDWDTKTLIETVGPLTTTGNDLWEMGVELGDIATGGVSTVALLMEPLGNIASDAYPCISSDDAANPQGSVYGSLSNPSAIGSSTIGNFLMDMYIYTAYGPVRATPVNFDLVEAPVAQARVAVNNVPELPVITQNAVSSRDVDPFIGANIYRNGVLIAELVQDTFYLDQNVNGGEFTYCLRYVYESGAMTCEDAYCLDLSVPCEAPVNLAGEYLWQYNEGNPEFGSLITWESATPPVAEWLYYDDGVNVDGIGGPASFSWAIKFDPAQLEDYAGASLTKISIYNRTGATDELRIYEGTNAATLLHTQPLSGLGIETWEEVDLTSPVLIDVTKQLWITVYTTDGVNYPAGCGNAQGQPNGDLITLDGVLWEHLTDYALPYTWNLRGYVTTAVGATVALPMDKPNDVYNNDVRAELTVSGTGAGENAVLETTASRELFVYNVYRSEDGDDYEWIAAVPFDAATSTYEYYDTDVDAQVGYYYQVTALHTYDDDTECESAPAMALDNPEDDFVYVFVTNVDELGAAEARMFPNPATNNVTIEAAGMNRITVINAVGQVVYDSEISNVRTQFNVASYEAGVYVVRINTESGVVTKRLTIVR
ncbi:MAG: carboxypeptidase regulatory-like domain-containing protein [Bacteroidales bacterium]|nr:carboxypeptidase regulatory-like domain-containing protein [Bacteroidales bacterium]